MIAAEKLTKVYMRGREEVKALDNISLEINEGEMVGILGPSGSGKTTLMNLIGFLDVPSSGQLTIKGRSPENMNNEDMLKVRRETLGFIFQQFLLIPTMTSLQNVLLPMLFTGKNNARELAVNILERVGLSERLDHLPSQMSGGEMQRVAIARALANDPAILLADEPTGNLDTRTSNEIFELFRDINGEGKTVVIITHNTKLAASLPRSVTLKDGRMVDDVRR